LFHADGQTGRHDESDIYFLQSFFGASEMNDNLNPGIMKKRRKKMGASAL